MNVLTLNDSDFEKACALLAAKIPDAGELTALVGVRSGGVRVAKIIFDVLVKQNDNLKYYEVGASRGTTPAKKSYIAKVLFKYMPYLFLDALRLSEHYYVSLKLKFSSDTNRSICLDDDLVDYLSHASAGKLVVIDDALDSGATVKELLDKFLSINPDIKYNVAVLVVTQKKPLIHPDLSLYQNVLLRFPWSGDYKS